MITTIQIEKSIKEKLDSLKIHQRESYNQVITRIVNLNPNKSDNESLTETIEVLSNPSLMRSIAKGIEDYNKGRFKTLMQVKKVLSIA